MNSKSLLVVMMVVVVMVAVGVQGYGNPCPGICTLEYAPVCGTDGVTYSNKCFLLDTKRCDKPYLEVDYPGNCRPY